MAGRKAGNYKQTVRCLRLLDRLRSARNGVAIEGLAEEFEVSARQVHRDRDALEMAGYSTETFSSEGGRVHLRLLDRTQKGLQITGRERYALMAARRVFDVLEGTPLHEDVCSIYHKLAAPLPPAEREELEKLGDRFVYLPDGGIKPYAKKEDLLNELLSGVLRRARVDFEYVRADGVKRTGVLEPFAMVLYRHGLYVLGRPAKASAEARGSAREQNLDAGNGAVRLYAAERFKRVKYRRGDTFELPDGFKVDNFFHGVFGIFMGGDPTRVVVEFSPEVRSAVEARRWHPSQKLTRLASGKLRLAFEVPNTEQVTPWVLSWGDHARVVEPAALATKLEGIVKRMARGSEKAGRSQPPPPLAL